MSFEYYKAQDSPVASAKRTSRLRGKEVESTPLAGDLTQTIRKRKRKVLADNTVVNVAGTPAPERTAKKVVDAVVFDEMDIDDDSQPIPEKTPAKQQKTPKKGSKPQEEKDEKGEEEDAQEGPSVTRTNANGEPLKRKAEADPVVLEVTQPRQKKYRKLPALENVPLLTSFGFAERLRTPIARAVARVGGTATTTAAVNKFVEEYISKNGTIRFYSKKDVYVPPKSFKSHLPPHPRTAPLLETEKLQRRRLAALQEEASTWKSLKSKALKPELYPSDLEFPGASSTKKSLDLLTEEERKLFERCGDSPSEYRASLENLVLQSDELLLRTKQLSQFSTLINDYFSRVASTLRREEIGDNAPLTLGKK